jgi:hypothetical protein
LAGAPIKQRDILNLKDVKDILEFIYGLKIKKAHLTPPVSEYLTTKLPSY